ncbi:MAG: MarR family winged helix-turn-helix transcriptional regulator [Pirellulaceae bacterium]|jgi:DNA-binding MarR family transcriptional regulator|nr:MarR family winged helix-turn-helix transcriptional regulator [Pirellulaceae bacterium]
MGASLEQEILVALRRIVRAMDTRSRVLLLQHGLTGPQLATLMAIARLQPVTAGAIAREVQLGHSTVTGILDRLERRGWIARARGEHDRRNVNLVLTATGQQLLATAPPLMQDAFRQRLADLAEWERTQILATLQRVGDMMDVPRGTVAPLLDKPAANAAGCRMERSASL